MAPPRRTVALTGGAGGIGLATAGRLLADGHQVAILDHNEESVSRAVGQLSEGWPTALITGVVCDTADEVSVGQALQEVSRRFGGLDGMVTAAGIRQTAAPAVELDIESWTAVLQVNLTGTFVAAREAAKVMLASGRGGSIVTVASVVGVSARVHQAAYSASKAAVIHLSRGLAVEWAPAGIRVNCVCPGVTSTPMIELAVKNEGSQVLDEKVFGSMAQFRPGIPLGRLAAPEEQASAIAFLLSDDASFITGATLGVDGGAGVV